MVERERRIALLLGVGDVPYRVCANVSLQFQLQPKAYHDATYTFIC